MYLYNRFKHSSVQFSENALNIESILIDDVHEMVLHMVIGLENPVIQDINFLMMRTPHECCKNVQSKANEMKGVTIVSGISKLAKEKLSESNGCYHLLDLFLEGIKVYKQGRTRLLFRKNDQKAIESTRKKLKDTCYYFTEINKKAND